jgi:anti-sigma factor RsiW
MRCHTIRTWIARNPETLSERQKRRIAVHLDTCEECKHASEHILRLNQAVERFKRETIPPHIATGLWKNVKNELVEGLQTTVSSRIPSKRVSRPVWSWAIPSLAAVCVIVFFALFRIWQTSPRVTRVDSAVFDIAVYSAEIDGHDAQVSIFHTDNPEMTFIWLDK